MENPLPCGCAIVGVPFLVSHDHYETIDMEYRDQRIRFCPLHAAAEQMLEALKQAEEWIIDETSWRTDADDLKAEIKAALAIAEPKEETQ